MVQLFLFLSHPLSVSSNPHLHLQTKSLSITPRFRLSCSSSAPPNSKKQGELKPRTEYNPNWLDDFFLNSFRNKLAQEVGWDSNKAGYDGLIELANGLMVGRTNHQTSEAAVRILTSLFPPFVLELYKTLITPIGGGKLAAIMVARVYVERCKYLEESKCVGVCINTCKLPTQAFFKDHMGIPLLMEPNFDDYSCQFSFGVNPPEPESDSSLRKPCLEICPNAPRQRKDAATVSEKPCPRA